MLLRGFGGASPEPRAASRYIEADVPAYREEAIRPSGGAVAGDGGDGAGQGVPGLRDASWAGLLRVTSALTGFGLRLVRNADLHGHPRGCGREVWPLLWVGPRSRSRGEGGPQGPMVPRGREGRVGSDFQAPADHLLEVFQALDAGKKAVIPLPVFSSPPFSLKIGAERAQLSVSAFLVVGHAGRFPDTGRCQDLAAALPTKLTLFP